MAAYSICQSNFKISIRGRMKVVKLKEETSTTDPFPKLPIMEQTENAYHDPSICMLVC